MPSPLVIQSLRAFRRAGDIFETRVQAEIEATVNKAPQEQWQNQDRRYEICFKMDAKAEVMSNRASKVSHFPPSRQKLMFLQQHTMETTPPKHQFRRHFGHGNFGMHTTLVNIVLRKCAPCFSGEHNFIILTIKTKKNTPRSIKNQNNTINLKRWQK